MQHNKISILSTTPLSRELLNSAEQNGFWIDIVPFIMIEAVVSDELIHRIRNFSSQSINVVFTSSNAADAVIKQLNGYKPLWRIFCIGNITRNVIITYFGNEAIAGIGNNASDLAKTIIKQGDVQHALFFCGDQRRDELPQLLMGNKIKVEEVIVYKTILVNNKISKDYQGILFFSPSAVSSFFIANEVSRQSALFAIGETTASTIKLHCNNEVIISKQAGKEDLVNTMITYYQSRMRQQKIN